MAARKINVKWFKSITVYTIPLAKSQKFWIEKFYRLSKSKIKFHLQFSSLRQYKSVKDICFSHIGQVQFNDGRKTREKTVTISAIPLLQMYACGLRYANAIFTISPRQHNKIAC
jgi:hypothetical protein